MTASAAIDATIQPSSTPEEGTVYRFAWGKGQMNPVTQTKAKKADLLEVTVVEATSERIRLRNTDGSEFTISAQHFNEVYAPTCVKIMEPAEKPSGETTKDTKGTKGEMPLGFIDVQGEIWDTGTVLLFESGHDWARVSEVDLEHGVLVVAMHHGRDATRSSIESIDFASWNEQECYASNVVRVVSLRNQQCETCRREAPCRERCDGCSMVPTAHSNAWVPYPDLWTDAADPQLPADDAATQAPRASGTQALANDAHLPIPRSVDVDISLIDVVSNPRTLFDEEDLGLLGASIADQGQLLAVTLCRQPNGRYRMIEGERRYRAAKARGLASLRAEVYDAELSEAQILRLQLTTFATRKDLGHAEKANALANYRDETGLSVAEISRSIGLGEDDVRKHLKLFELDLRVRRMVLGDDEQGRSISLNKAVTIGRVPKDDQYAMAERCWLQGWSEQELTEAVNEKLAPAVDGGLLPPAEPAAPAAEPDLPGDDELEKTVRGNLQRGGGGTDEHDIPNPNRLKRTPADGKSTADARHEQAKKDADAKGGGTVKKPVGADGEIKVKDVAVSISGTLEIDDVGFGFLTGVASLRVGPASSPDVKVIAVKDLPVDVALGELLAMARARQAKEAAAAKAKSKASKKVTKKASKKAAKKTAGKGK